MKLLGVELRRVRLPLVTPFRTPFGTEYERDALLVRAVTGDAEGWGECVAMPQPSYSSEYLDGATQVLRRYLIPALAEATSTAAEGLADAERADGGRADAERADGGRADSGRVDATRVDAERTKVELDDVGRMGAGAGRAGGALIAAALEVPFAAVKGHRMAKAALQTAVLDAQLRTAGMSLACYLGAVRGAVPAGVSVGIADSIDDLLDEVAGYLRAGYRRVKLKIEPGWDVEPVRAARELVGDGFPLQVDANGAYTLADAAHLARLDAYDLVLIEQPLPEEDLRGHAALARRLATPICLDEPITSARAAVDAIMLGAASVVNIKPGRVGGYLEARRVHDVCAAHGVPVWVGGMVETGLGRAANLALAALPNCGLVGDVSGSGRFFGRDVTRPFTVDDGEIAVPDGPGIGVDPDPGSLDAATTHTEWIGLVRTPRRV